MAVDGRSCCMPASEAEPRSDDEPAAVPAGSTTAASPREVAAEALGARPAPAAERTSTNRLVAERSRGSAWVHVPGGSYRMGSDDADAVPGDGEGPSRVV